MSFPRLAKPYRQRLTIDVSRRVPYDVLTVDRVLELASSAGLEDPEEFLVRCSSLGLDPLEVLHYARIGARVGQPEPRRYVFRAKRSLFWRLFPWAWLVCALYGLAGAIRTASVLDGLLSGVLILGAILAISVESRRFQ